jgi:hypothetical protein
MRIDVYIYPVAGFSGIAPGEAVPPARALARETAQFKEILDSGMTRGWWDSYKIAYEEDESLALPEQTVPGYLVMLVTRHGKVEDASAFYIFDVRNEFVKIRITMPYTEFRGGRPMTEFEEGLITALARQHP